MGQSKMLTEKRRNGNKVHFNLNNKRSSSRVKIHHQINCAGLREKTWRFHQDNNWKNNAKKTSFGNLYEWWYYSCWNLMFILIGWKKSRRTLLRLMKRSCACRLDRDGRKIKIIYFGSIILSQIEFAPRCPCYEK